MKNIELFDQYIKGTLTASEAESFERSLNADAALYDEFNSFRSMVLGIQQAERLRLKALLLNDSQRQQSPRIIELPQRSWGKMWYAAAAAVVLLLCAIPVYRHFTFNDRLYSSYLLEEKVDNLMGANDFVDSTENDLRWYETGLKHRNNGEYNKAIEVFAKVSEQSINHYFLSQYDIALIHIKQGNSDSAIAILKQLTNRHEQHFVKDKVTELLNELTD